MSSGKWGPFCLGLNVLKGQWWPDVGPMMPAPGYLFSRCIVPWLAHYRFMLIHLSFKWLPRVIISIFAISKTNRAIDGIVLIIAIVPLVGNIVDGGLCSSRRSAVGSYWHSWDAIDGDSNTQGFCSCSRLSRRCVSPNTHKHCDVYMSSKLNPHQ